MDKLKPNTIALAPYPDESCGVIDWDIMALMEIFQIVIIEARKMKKEYTKEVPIEFVIGNRKVFDLFVDQPDVVAHMLKTDKSFIKVSEAGDTTVSIPNTMIKVVTTKAGPIEIRMPLISEKKDAERIQKELASISKELDSIEIKLSNKNFIAKAQKEIVEQTFLKKKILLEAKTLLESKLNEND